MRLQFAILHKVFCSPVDSEDCVTDKSTVEQEVRRLRHLSRHSALRWTPTQNTAPLALARTLPPGKLDADAAYWWAVLHPLQAQFATESGVLDTKTMADMGMRTVHGTPAC